MTDSRLTTILEHAEASAWADFYRPVDDGIAAALGLRVIERSAGLVTIAASVDVLAFNRVLGIGLDADLDEKRLDAILHVFCDAGLNRAFLQVPPGVLDGRVESLLVSRGLVLHNHWVKLWRGVEELPDVRTDLEITEIGAEMGAAFGSVVVESFGWPAGVSAMVAAPVGREGWRHYAALDGGRIVATAAAFRAADSV